MVEWTKGSKAKGTSDAADTGRAKEQLEKIRSRLEGVCGRRGRRAVAAAVVPGAGEAVDRRGGVEVEPGEDVRVVDELELRHDDKQHGESVRIE